ncbi:hypothetical protein BDV59DRAFT_124875 [Aspergillus ambiguus]|uniref:uncharacterized protein n=1 Tax=Aspergillus ambiguus TaxID=176160 RepID=UPI003CCD175D
MKYHFTLYVASYIHQKIIPTSHEESSVLAFILRELESASRSTVHLECPIAFSCAVMSY